MMKPIYLVIAVLIFTVGCDRGLQFSNTDTSKPGINCIVEPEALSVPTLVQQGQGFSMSYNREDVGWSLSNGTTDLSFEGSQIDTTLNELGTYVGSVSGKNNCNKIDGREFTIQVIERVEGLSLVINNNDRYTRNQNVSLSLSAIGATEVYVTNNSTCSAGGTWATYNSSKAWSLGETNRLTRVYAKFRNSLIETPCISDDITHDNVAPLVRFVSSPAAVSSSKTATFEFAAEDVTSGVKSLFCKLDGASYQVCALRMTYANLSEGAHTVSIYAEDNAGNVSTEVAHSWTVDSLAPTVRITQAPVSPSNSRSARFAFDGDDNGVAITNFECSVDGSSFQTCSSPKDYTNLAEGSHTFRVRGKDRAGNLSGEASHTWIIDSQAPTVRITQAPASPTKEVNAHFEFTAQDSGLGLSTIKCQLDGQAAVDCINSADYTALPNGIHTFRVTATDVAGNSGSAVHTWEVNDKITDQIIPITDNGGRVDILMVVDNSESMFNELREEIPYRFDRFVRELDSLDYRIAVTTTDARGILPYEAGGLANLLRQPTPGNGHEVMPLQKVITPSMPNAENIFIATIMRPEAICVETGTHMCPITASPYEEPIRSSILSVERADTQFFFRDEADLHMIMISDTDEAAGTQTYSTGQPLPNINEYNNPVTLVNKVNQKWPGKKFKVHGVFNRPGDGFCQGNTKPGHLLSRIVNLTQGTAASICDRYDMDRTQISAIANNIKNGATSSYTLTCEPKDLNNDGRIDAQDVTATYNPQPAQTPVISVSGRSISFNPRLPTGTSVSLRYICK